MGESVERAPEAKSAGDFSASWPDFKNQRSKTVRFLGSFSYASTQPPFVSLSLSYKSWRNCLGGLRQAPNPDDALTTEELVSCTGR